jgi:hypothetical protein
MESDTHWGFAHPAPQAETRGGVRLPPVVPSSEEPVELEPAVTVRRFVLE